MVSHTAQQHTHHTHTLGKHSVNVLHVQPSRGQDSRLTQDLMKLEALQVCAVATAKGTVELQTRKQKGANSEW